MATQSKVLADRLKLFNDDMIRFIHSLDENQWRTRCESEAWPLCVVARHVGATHYRAVELVKIIIAGQPLPEFSRDTINQMNEAHARKHADCPKDKVLALFETHGRSLVEYVQGLNDAALNRTAHVPALNTTISAGGLLEEMILKSGGEHLVSMKKTIGA